MDRTWIDRIIAVTGHTGTERHVYDWAAAEQQLGVRLPTDYKELAETFGPGMFGEWLELMLPTGDGEYGSDLLATWSRNLTPDTAGFTLWEPYGLHPKPGGLLEWGSTPDGQMHFYWAVEGDDPERWPVISAGDDYLFDRHEYTTAEQVHRELTRVLDTYDGLQGFITFEELVARYPRPDH